MKRRPITNATRIKKIREELKRVYVARRVAGASKAYAERIKVLNAGLRRAKSQGEG